MISANAHVIQALGNSYEVWGCSVRGRSHLKEDKPCQDANYLKCDIYHDKPYMLGVIADGHGAQLHDLSEHGSRLAVRVVISYAAQLCDCLEREQDLKKPLPISNILHGIFQEWEQRVMADFVYRTSREPEKYLCEGLTPERIYERYGTTLLFCLYYGDQWLFAQLGDGDIYYCPPPEPDCRYQPQRVFVHSYSNITHSVCERDIALWEIKRQKANPDDYVFLASDGFSDSFDGENGDIEELSTWVNGMENNFRRTGDNLVKFLDKFQEGSQNITNFLPKGDDITMYCLTFHTEVSRHQLPLPPLPQVDTKSSEGREKQNQSDEGDSPNSFTGEAVYNKVPESHAKGDTTVNSQQQLPSQPRLTWSPSPNGNENVLFIRTTQYEYKVSVSSTVPKPYSSLEGSEILFEDETGRTFLKIHLKEHGPKVEICSESKPNVQDPFCGGTQQGIHPLEEHQRDFSLQEILGEIRVRIGNKEILFSPKTPVPESRKTEA